MSLHTYIDHPQFTISSKPLPEDSYREVLRSLAVVCVDIVIVDFERQTFYLPTRIVEPIKGLWVIGGRLRAGEPYEVAAARKFKEEAALDVDPERLSYVTTNRYITALRKQAPVEEGSDTIGFTFAIELTPAERLHVSAHLDPREYDVSAGLLECTREDLVKKNTHRALVDMFDALFAQSN